MNRVIGFICGVPDAWDKEHLCKECKLKLEEVDWKDIKVQIVPEGQELIPVRVSLESIKRAQKENAQK